MEVRDDLLKKEISEMRSELREIHADLLRLMERSNREQIESILDESRRGFLKVLIHHLEEEAEDRLRDGMVEDCEMREACKDRFSGMLKEAVGLFGDDAADGGGIEELRSKLMDLQSRATYVRCDRCFSEASTLMEKRIDLLRSMRIYEKADETRADSQELPEEAVVKEILEPLNSWHRLQILKALISETKPFSSLSELTGLRGGNLLFHIQKLLESGMILQRHDRGDYMITERGYRAILGIAEVHSKVRRGG